MEIDLQILLDVRSAAGGTAAFRVRDPDGTWKLLEAKPASGRRRCQPLASLLPSRRQQAASRLLRFVENRRKCRHSELYHTFVFNDRDRVSVSDWHHARCQIGCA